jgi:sulfite reductase alpha subunit-like flavoprotein
VAGGPKMARAVKDVILEALSAALKSGEKDANQFLLRLFQAGRYSVEAWS